MLKYNTHILKCTVSLKNKTFKAIENEKLYSKVGKKTYIAKTNYKEKAMKY